MADDFSPKIIAFCCNWCAYAGADLAGVSRLQYPPNLRVIRVMCSGRVNPNFILRAFAKGADGVLVAGWHIGDCHYLDGNVKAKDMMEQVKELMRILGIEEGRVRLEWISSAEGPKFAEVARDFTRRIRELGPSQAKAA
jgi:F420-non-reducing hydrogenase iron-sulfur subunit